MTYTINKTNGDILATIVDGTKNTTSSSLTLIGKNATDFGESQNENFVKLLENFSSNTAPANAITGQLWFQSNVQSLKYYSGSEWKAVSTLVSTVEPVSLTTGDLWWDQSNAQLKVYSGTEWISVAPLYNSTQGKTGAIVETIVDQGSVPHYCVVLYSAGDRVAIVSKDDEFTPASAITGFTTIQNGFNLRETSSLVIGGYTTNNNSGDITVTNSVNNKDITFKLNVSGTTRTVLQLDGATGQLFATIAPVSSSSLTNKNYVDNAIATYADGAIADAIAALPDAPVVSVAGKIGIVSLTVNDIRGAAPLLSPEITGVPTAPTPTSGDNSTKIATTAFVSSAISTAVDGKWEGSAKFVRTDNPSPVNGNNGDFWFRI